MRVSPRWIPAGCAVAAVAAALAVAAPTATAARPSYCDDLSLPNARVTLLMVTDADCDTAERVVRRMFADGSAHPWRCVSTSSKQHGVLTCINTSRPIEDLYAVFLPR